MSRVRERSKDQERWDEIGRQRLDQIVKDPTAFVTDSSPYEAKAFHDDLLTSLGPHKGKRILELGSGRGEFSVFLAKQGAEVTGIDIGSHLVEASSLLAEINHVKAQFLQANVTRLPFGSRSFDAVVGLLILHHLSQPDLQKALAEAHRVLREGGAAVFYEPVEDSRVFDFLQDLFPVGKRGEPGHRPSVLQRRLWKDYAAETDQRSLTTRELGAAGSLFRSIEIHPHGFLVRLTRLLGRPRRKALEAIDRFLFRAFPPVKRLCRNVLVVYRK